MEQLLHLIHTIQKVHHIDIGVDPDIKHADIWSGIKGKKLDALIVATLCIIQTHRSVNPVIPVGCFTN